MPGNKEGWRAQHAARDDSIQTYRKTLESKGKWKSNKDGGREMEAERECFGGEERKKSEDGDGWMDGLDGPSWVVHALVSPNRENGSVTR